MTPSTIAKSILANTLLLLTLSASAQMGPPPQQADMQVDKAQRTRLISSLIAHLEKGYVFPEKAKAMASALSGHQKRGDYDKITSAEALAQKLSEHMYAVSSDKHLRLFYSERPIPEADQENKPSEAQRMEELAQMQALNFGVERIERLPFNIGYLDLRAFAAVKDAAPTIGAAMSALAHTSALIIDLRKNGGGDPSTVALVASYFLDERTHLNDMYYRKGDRTEQMWSVESVGGAHYGQKKDLYLLTSADTFSAAEDLSYTLKHLKRATIVGETTGGGAHPGDMVRLDQHMAMFLPNGRTINPISKSNWEGTGVAPDLAVSAGDAFKTAQLAILKKIADAEKQPGRLGRIKARMAAVAGEAGPAAGQP